VSIDYLSEYILRLPDLALPLESLYFWADSYPGSAWLRIADGACVYDYFEIRGEKVGGHSYTHQIISRFQLNLSKERVALHRMDPGSFVPVHTDHSFIGPPRKSVLIIPFQVPCDGVSYYSESGEQVFSCQYNGPVIIRADRPHGVVNNLKINRYTIQFSLDDPLEHYIRLHREYNRLLAIA
jgi:hypothetical protein